MGSTTGSIIIQVKGKEVVVGTVAPTSPKLNDLWLDTTNEVNNLKYWNGKEWVLVNDTSSKFGEIYETLKNDYYTKTESENMVSTVIGKTTITTKDGNVVNMVDTINSTLETATESKKTISEIEKNIGDISETVKSHGSSIEQTQNSIKNKVWQDDVKTIVNNLEIGGRNLLHKYIRAGGQTKKVDDLTIIIGTGLGDTHFYLKSYHDLIQGETYTLSCEASNVPNGCDWTFGIRVQNSTSQLRINKNGKCFVTFKMDKNINKDTEFLVDDLNGRPTTAPNITLTNFKLEKGNKVTDWSPAPEDVQNAINSAVDNIQIGGTNLIKNSKEGFALTGSDTSSVSQRNGTKVTTLTTGKGNAWCWIKDYLVKSVSEIKNCVEQSFTFSLEVKVTGSFKNLHFSLDVRNGSNKCLVIEPYINDDCEKNKWFRISATNTVKATSVDMANCLICATWSDSTVGSTVEYRLVKLELGNKATDWTPAPEDVNNSIETVSSQVSTLEQDLSGFQLSVSENYSTKTEVKTSIDNSINNIQVGGRNLFQLSNLKELSSKSLSVIDSKSFRAKIWATIIYENTWVKKNLITNTQYTMSGYMTFEKGSSLPQSHTQIGFTLYNPNTKINIHMLVTQTLTVGNKVYFKNSFSTPNDLTNFVLLCYTARYTDGSNTEYGQVLYEEVKLEKGNKATDWTPAPEDIESFATDKASTALADAKSYANAEISKVNTSVNEAKSDVSILKNQISLKVEKTDIEKAVTETKLYANQIKGNNLVVNGDGSLGKTTGWINGVQFSSDAPNGSYGSFIGQTEKIYTTFKNDETYDLSFYLKNKSGNTGVDYFSMIPYDSENNIINWYHVNYVGLTKLTKELKNGDTVIYCENLSGWNIDNANNYNYWRYIGFHDYTNKQGYTYPAGTYTRNIYTEAFSNGSSINKTSNTITLKTAWTGGNKPVGTYIAQHYSGSNYIYFGLVNKIPPTDWTQYSVQSITQKADKRLSYVSAIAFKMLMGKAWISNLVFNRQATTITEVNNKISTAKAEIKVTTDAISQSVSSLQTTVSQKADSSTVTALTTRTANLETGLGGIAGRVSSVESTVKTVGDTASSALSKIDGLEIGGRNLAPLSNIQNYAGGNLSKNKYYTVDGTKIIAINQALNSSLIGYKIYTNDTFIYTYSGYTDLSKIDIYFRCYDFSDTIIQAQVYINTYVYNGKFTLTFDNIPNNTYYFNIGIGSTSVSDYYIDKLKLEKGNKATDWTPAPEDQEDFATDKANTALNSAKNYTDGKITTVNEKIAEINITTEGITQRVSSTESTVLTHTNQLNTVDNRINTAKNSAISTASADATTKANNAQTNSNSYTDGQITTVNKTITNKVAEIKATTDGITSKVEKVEQIATGSQGKMLYTDPTFTKGMNGISIYNNSGNGTVVVSRVTKSSDCPTKSNYMLQITTSGTSSPHNGGFYFATKTRANAIFITKIIAKLPTGTEITWHTNEYGTGGKQEWLTPTNGTGNWKEYICKVTCGTSGTFLPTNCFALKGGTIPVTWYLAYATVYDLTDSSNIELRMSSAEQKITDEAIVSTVTKSTTYKDALNGKVSTSSIISCINQTAEAIKINASKINLTGAVTISALATETVNKLNTAYNTANTANSTANSVNSTVTSNKANWDKGLTAYNWTNSYGSRTNSLYSMITKWTDGAISDTTQINGGWIKTNTITADKIATSTIAVIKSSISSNLIRNSSGVNGTSMWTNNAGTLGVARGNYNGFATSYFMYLDNGTKTTETLAYSRRFKLKPNTKYTLSGWFNNQTKCPHFDVWVLAHSTMNESELNDMSYSVGYRLIAEANTNGVWKKYSVSFTTGSVVSGYLRIDNNGYNASGTNNNRIHWSSLMLNEGEEQAWSPHPDEVYSGYTYIDASGVTIKNGALRILNNAGTTVLSGDSNGNLSISANLSLGGSNNKYGILNLYNSSNLLEVQLDYNGVRQYSKGKYIGRLGTNLYSSGDKYLSADYDPSTCQGFEVTGYGLSNGLAFRTNVSETTIGSEYLNLKCRNLSFVGSTDQNIIWQNTYNGNRVGFFGGGSESGKIHVGMYDWGNINGANAGYLIWSYNYGGTFEIVKYCKFSGGTNISSTKDIKCDIRLENNTYSALELIRNTDFYRYKLKGDVKDGYADYENIGVIVEYKTPDIFKSRDKDGINLYTMCSTTMLAVKEIDTRNTEHNKKILQLKNKIEVLQSEINGLKQLLEYKTI